MPPAIPSVAPLYMPGSAGVQSARPPHAQLIRVPWTAVTPRSRTSPGGPGSVSAMELNGVSSSPVPNAHMLWNHTSPGYGSQGYGSPRYSSPGYGSPGYGSPGFCTPTGTPGGPATPEGSLSGAAHGAGLGGWGSGPGAFGSGGGAGGGISPGAWGAGSLQREGNAHAQYYRHVASPYHMSRATTPLHSGMPTPRSSYGGERGSAHGSLFGGDRDGAGSLYGGVERRGSLYGAERELVGALYGLESHGSLQGSERGGPTYGSERGGSMYGGERERERPASVYGGIGSVASGSILQGSASEQAVEAILKERARQASRTPRFSFSNRDRGGRAPWIAGYEQTGHTGRHCDMPWEQSRTLAR